MLLLGVLSHVAMAFVSKVACAKLQSLRSLRLPAVVASTAQSVHQPQAKVASEG